jgi:2-aminoethylphosphonate-pyruvate transaminase
VVAVDGDGAALMRMGVFATLGAYGPANLTHVLLDNNAHDSTGGQATVSHNVSFAGVAAACGYASAIEGDNLDMLDACWPARPRPRRARISSACRPRRHARRAAAPVGHAGSQDAPGRQIGADQAQCRRKHAAAESRPGHAVRTRAPSLLQPTCAIAKASSSTCRTKRARLLDIYGLDPAEWAAVLMTGSGTAALESMIAALVPANGKLLIVQNGVYGERIAQIAAQYQIAHAGEARMDGSARPGRIDAALAEDPAITARGRDPSRNHHGPPERPAGDRPPVPGARRASAGGHGEQLRRGSDRLRRQYRRGGATANKCLHGVPGAAFVIVRRSALTNAASRTYYLDLVRLAKLQDQRNTPFTPSVHAYYALVEALREHQEEGGWKGRHQRYAALAEQARAGLAALGIEALWPAEQSSVVLRAYRLPQGRHVRAAARRPEGARLRDLRRPGRPVVATVPHLDDGRDHGSRYRPADRGFQGAGAALSLRLPPSHAMRERGEHAKSFATAAIPPAASATRPA